MTLKRISITELQEIAGSFALKVVGITDLTPLPSAGKALKIWQNEGWAGQMNYMLRPAEFLSEPLKLHPEARSAICFGAGYSSAPRQPLALGFGRVARYAWGLDYHKALPSKLNALMERLSTLLGVRVNFKIFSDAVPLLERALAQRAGLGFIGKNTMLIRPRIGSYFFLCEVFSDLEVSGYECSPQETNCGRCTNCQESCPTAALREEFRLDARRCISYLSIEKRGLLSVAEQAALGEWVFGCDICQEVCPFNHAVQKANLPAESSEFDARAGVGPFLDLASLLRLRSEGEFRRRFASSAVMRTGRKGLLRNAMAVAANTGALCVVADMLRVASEDSSEQLRMQALDSLSRMSAWLERSQLEKLKFAARRACASEWQVEREQAFRLLEII